MNTATDKSPKDGAASLNWLALGAFAGLIAAAYGLLVQDEGSSRLPPDAVARVNDTIIGDAELERALAQAGAAPGRQLTGDDRLRVLERLIEDELLVQRGIDLGLVTSESTVRNAIVQSLIASVTAEADAADPGDEILQAFLEQNADRYTYASAMSIDAWTTGEEKAARAFLARLQSDPDAVPDESLADVPGLPEGPAPLARLRMFVGPAIAAAAADMPIGSSAIFARRDRWYVLRVNGREETAIADLDSVRSQVLLDYRRSLAEERLAAYLADLRARADITVVLPD